MDNPSTLATRFLTSKGAAGGHVPVHAACGVRNRNAEKRYLEILGFQHFARFTTFTTDGEDFRNEVMKGKIEFSVVLDIECEDMFALCFK